MNLFVPSGKRTRLSLPETRPTSRWDYTTNSLLDEGVITLLGLPESSPAFNNPSNVLRWENVAGIKEISFFSDGSGGIEYIYVKAQTD